MDLSKRILSSYNSYEEKYYCNDEKDMYKPADAITSNNAEKPENDKYSCDSD